MQMFRKPIDRAIQGDRIGICVTQFDPDKLERGLISTPGIIKIFYGLIIRINKVKHFKHEIESRTKFHITSGHSTVMGRIVLFADYSGNKTNQFDFEKEYEAIDQYPSDDALENKQIFVCLIELYILSVLISFFSKGFD
jgi:selenocysteine-specific elongation factor